jgi:ABC-type oligopeptide transport system ATPase subunit
MTTPAPLLSMREITLDYGQGVMRKPFRALHGVDLDVRPRETVGLVGESGSGKTSLARVLLGLQRPTSGSIRFDGEDITQAGRRRRRALSADLQAVFQDPHSSLNPTRRIGTSIAEPLMVRRGALTPRQIRERVADMLRRVGLPEEAARRYPAHFSGGQRQRIAIARALIVSPKLVVCDEPVSALDLSVQAQVLNLLAELQESLGLSYLFIAHDLAVVRFLSHRIVVMREGRVVESGAADQVYSAPRHEYTKQLLASIPSPDPDDRPEAFSAKPGGPPRDMQSTVAPISIGGFQ